MCTRFVFEADEEQIKAAFDVENIIGEIHNNYNVTLTSQIYAVVQDESGRALRSFEWDFKPYWLKKEEAKQSPTSGKWSGPRGPWYNTKSENVLEVPRFKEFLRQPCVVPVRYWVEFPMLNGKKTPFLFGLESQELMGFAAHWDIWKSPKGDEIESCSIITCPANELVAKYHPKERQPVILTKDEQRIWLDPSNRDPNNFKPIFKTFPANELYAFQVSNAINNVRSEGPELIVPVSPN